MEQIIKPKSLGGFVRNLSGLFITKTNPTGISPKECSVLAQLIFILSQRKEKVINKEVKLELANMNNHSLQVATNYITKFRTKGVVMKDNTINPIFLKTRIIIEYGEDNL